MTTAETLHSSKTYTHDNLVLRAMLFAKISLNCQVAGKDIGGRINGHNEIADLWGFTFMHSHRRLRSMYGSWLFEIKASRSDFLADLKKAHRQPGADALGRWRTYYAAPGIIHPHEIPKGWGLIEPHGEHRHRYLAIPKPFELSPASLQVELKIAARLSREWELLRSSALQYLTDLKPDERENLDKTTTTGWRQYSHVIAKYESDLGNSRWW